MFRSCNLSNSYVLEVVIFRSCELIAREFANIHTLGLRLPTPGNICWTDGPKVGPSNSHNWINRISVQLGRSKSVASQAGRVPPKERVEHAIMITRMPSSWFKIEFIIFRRILNPWLPWTAVMSRNYSHFVSVTPFFQLFFQNRMVTSNLDQMTWNFIELLKII